MKINVEGMACSGCEKRIQNALMEIDGIKSVKASHEIGVVEIILDKEIDRVIIENIIEEIGFTVVKGEE